MRFLVTTLLALAVLGVVASAAFAADETAEEPKAYDFGETVKDLEGPGLGDTTVKLSDLEITKAKAEAAVLEVAKAYADGQSITLETAIAKLPGVLDDGELDETLQLELIAKAGQHFGLVPSEEGAAKASTLADVVKWVMASESSPILVMVWSPKCPMCKGIYDERVQAILGETGVRLLAIAGSYPDKSEDVQDYLEGNGYHWQVILDPEQKLVDVLGGRKTPHLFLLDKDHKLIYRGNVDNDPRDSMEGEDRKENFRSAIEAVKAETEIEVTDTEPTG